MKRMIMGLVLGLIIGTSTNAFAAIGDVVSATFADFSYVVNGSPKTIGSPALVYLGKSYIPTTEIANMLGYDITYKSDSRTIEFNNLSATPTPLPVATPTTVTGGTYSPAPTPTANATPTPSSQVPADNTGATPLPSTTPAASSAPSATPNVEPTPAPTPYVGPTNEQVQFCQQYRMDPDVAAAHGC